MRFHKSNIIHPTAVIEDGVKMGMFNKIGPYCYITNNTVIGDNCTFEAYCSIGTVAEHKSYFDKPVEHPVVICDNTVIREFVTINAGTVEKTIIGNDCVLLRGSHVGHDSQIGHSVTLSCNVLIGGHSIVMPGVNMGLGSICHQRAIIGSYSMIGMGAIITKKSLITPGSVWVGNPARFLKDNEVGLIHHKVTEEILRQEQQRYQELIENNANK